jgi:hypothetical protein
LIDGLFMIGVCCVTPVLGAWFWIRTWRDQYSIYENGGIFSRIFGENARNGFDAGFPAFVTIAGLGLAMLSVPIGLDSMGVSGVVDSPLTAVLGRTCQVLLVLGLVTSWSLLLFMFPTSLVPPHLRGQRGWVSKWRHQARERRAQRRARRGSVT